MADSFVQLGDLFNLNITRISYVNNELQICQWIDAGSYKFSVRECHVKNIDTFIDRLIDPSCVAKEVHPKYSTVVCHSRDGSHLEVTQTDENGSRSTVLFEVDRITQLITAIRFVRDLHGKY